MGHWWHYNYDHLLHDLDPRLGKVGHEGTAISSTKNFWDHSKTTK